MIGRKSLGGTAGGSRRVLKGGGEVMTTFDKREQAFESQFVHDEEMRFKAVARSNKLLGNWAAGKLGLTGEAATSYANALVVAELDHKSGEDSLHKVLSDLAPRG